MAKPAAKTEFLRLLSQGLSQKEARIRVGVSKPTAYRWTHPEKDAEMASRAAARATCDCGRGMAAHATRCKRCYTGPDTERRDRFITAWNEGQATFFLA